GLALGAQGDYARARGCGQHALDIATEIEHGLWQTFAHFLLGALEADLLMLPTAREHLEQAVILAKESGSLFWRNNTSGLLASICIAQGDLPAASVILSNQAVSLTSTPTVAQRLVLAAQVELHLAQKQPEQALDVLE